MPQTPARRRASQISEDDLNSIVNAVISSLPAPPAPKNGVGTFLTGFGGLMLTIILSVAGYIYGIGMQADKISNIQANVSDLKSTTVSKDDLNARLGELKSGQDNLARTVTEMSDRLARLESKAMNER